MEAQVEASHWWFTGRRKLFRSVLGDLNPDMAWRVLDVGTSTGTNLRLLREMGFANVTGVDQNLGAIRFCREKGLGDVTQGDVQNLPFKNAAFDLVLATDIIEHVDDEAQAMHELTRVLVPGGKLLLTVPAFMALWGHDDERAHHKRRYTARQLLVLTHATDLRVITAFYFNFLLFPPIWITRQILRNLTQNPPPENTINSPAINHVLTWIFTLDVKLARVLRVPFGVSYMALCEKEHTGPSVRSGPGAAGTD